MLICKIYQVKNKENKFFISIKTADGKFQQQFCLCAQHGRQLDGESPLWGLVVATISQGQGCPS